MKFSTISIIAVMFVVIAVAVAGCSSSTPSPQSTGGTQAAGSSSGSSGGSGSAVSGAGLFSGLSYNWVEYKMSTSASNGMTIYYKYDHSTGKCSMRFEGGAAANMPANMQNIDCSSKGGTTQNDPNKVNSNAQISCSPIDESVTVPAGTFSATKCTVTSSNNGQTITSTVWVVKNKFLVKMEANTPQGTMDMVLNQYG